jgi:hypothetical protein
MKKILLLIILVVGLSGCNLDINTDPNYPTDVPANLILPAVESAIATTVGDAMFNYSGFFAQYYDQRPEANQYNEIAEYYFTEQDQLIDRSYRTLYAGALEDINAIRNKTTNSADIYAATVLRVFCFQLLVDNMDQAPYTEALQGSSNSMPKFDSGQSIYEGVLAELDEAEANLDNLNMECSDLLFNKSIAQWQGFANALRLRMYLKFIDAGIEASTYTAKVKALVDANKFFTGDVKFDAYSDELDKRNPWYATNKVSLAMNHCASYPIVAYLQATADPRIAYSFEKAVNSGDYAGQLPGSKKDLVDKKNADYSELKYYATKPVYFFTQSELQFLLAEIYIRFYSNDAKAKAAYEAGIDADFAARNMSESPSVMYGGSGTVAWSTATGNNAKLALIYMQKWVALFYMDHMEAWSEIRRTDYPKLSSSTAKAINSDPTIYTPGELISPMRNSFGEGNMVKRMFFPLSARQLNTNTPATVAATVPVWWDKN